MDTQDVVGLHQCLVEGMTRAGCHLSSREGWARELLGQAGDGIGGSQEVARLETQARRPDERAPYKGDSPAVTGT